MVNLTLVATEITVTEIFQRDSVSLTVIQEIASRRLWMLDSNMQVFNSQENVGLVTHMESMERDQTVSAI